MSNSDIYNLIVLKIIRFVLIFNFNNGIRKTSRLGLVCCRAQKSLLLFKLKFYIFKNDKSDNASIIPKIKAKSSLIIFFHNKF